MNHGKVFMFATLALCSVVANGYELTTHAAITLNAFRRSDLGMNAALSKRLGLEVLINDPITSPAPFTDIYIDMQNDTQAYRSATGFERKIIDGDDAVPGLGIPSLTVPGWLMRGAIREDDGGFLLGFRLGVDGEPYDDPYGNINRWCNHFFDPYHASSGSDGGATFLCPIDKKESAVNWAIGTQNAFDTFVTENEARRNHFSLYDAREAMYRAITGLNRNGFVVDPGFPFANESVRKAYWATMFRALGDILHLNQDMAQPEHARDESHGGVLARFKLDRGGPSAFEKFIDARARRDTTYFVDGTTTDFLPELVFGPYAIPVFGSYAEFWSTGLGTSSLTGKGLADYSNHGYLTFSNNIGATRFPSPPSSISAYQPVESNYPPGLVNRFRMRYLARPVVDQNEGSTSDPIRMVRESMWKDFSGFPVYSVDRNVYDDTADMLVPRAVAYSAGLLNFFFRGQLDISLPDEGVYAVVDHSKVNLSNPYTDFEGFNKIRLKLAKLSPIGDSMLSGQLRAVLKFHRNNCFRNDLSAYPPYVDWVTCRAGVEEIVVSNAVLLNGEIVLTEFPQQLEFIFPYPLPLNATDVRLQVVFRGKLGTEEDAVVVATKDISEPTFFSYQNASDYILISNKVYTRNEVNALPGLLAKIQPQSLVDYSQSPARLKPTSLQPFSLGLNLTFDSQHLTNIAVDSLQPGEFIRIAILGEPRLPASAPTPNVIVGRDTVQQCLPSTFNITPVNWQDTYDADTNTLTTYYPEFSKVRGIAGWAFDSCVVNGDGSPPGGTDDRKTKMIPAAYDNPQPVAVVINAGAGF